jgi:hypothetical protein
MLKNRFEVFSILAVGFSVLIAGALTRGQRLPASLELAAPSVAPGEIRIPSSLYPSAQLAVSIYDGLARSGAEPEHLVSGSLRIAVDGVRCENGQCGWGTRSDAHAMTPGFAQSLHELLEDIRVNVLKLDSGDFEARRLQITCTRSQEDDACVLNFRTSGAY